MREFFDQNETVIVFAHGVVFFALGFAVWLQRRRATRLTLTSSLIWLASFAVLEAVGVWGYVFVPIQASFLDPGVVEALIVVRALVLTAGFVFLLQFGIRLLPVSRRVCRVLALLSVLVWAAILLVGTWLASRNGWTTEEWERSVEAMARYALLFPGAVLSAVGLWRQREVLGAAGMPGIRPWATIAAAAMAMYAIIAGLVIEPAAWAPGGPVTEDGWFDATGLPMALLRAGLGLVLLVAVVKLLEIFEVEAKQRLEALDRARAVAEERARFGRDLHDGTIQSIYACGLHLEALAMRVEDPGMREEVREIVGNLNGTIDGLRGYINALKGAPDSPAGIAAALERLTGEFAAETGMPVSFSATGIESAGPPPDEAGQHMAHILREALANVARHAGPCETRVRLEFRADEMTLSVTDTGCGLPADPGAAADTAAGHGNGMRNMHERARWLGGRMQATRSPAGGTSVAVSIPLDDESPASIPIDLTPGNEVSRT